MLVAGEPGIGKTRVAAEVSAAAHGDGATVLYGRCDEDTLVPHQPFVEALTQLLAGVGSERLAALLGDTAPDLARLLPDLPRRLELDAAPAGDAEMSRYLMFEAVSGLLRETTLRAPAMIVLDDLHWADAPTLRLLRHLVTQAQPERLLVVGTYRDTDLDRTHPLAAVLADLRKETTVDRVLLGGLSEPEIASLLEKVRDQSADEQSKALAAALHQETEGNPFFVREVLRHLVETGALYQRDGRWTSDVPATTVGIPEGVRDVIGRRLSRLDDQTNEALAAAAVLGRDFALDDLVAVTGVAPDALVAMLDGAVAAAVVTEVAGAVDRWAFTHALVRQTLTEELTTSRRVRLHRDIARAIAARPDAADRVSELALHYGEAAAAGCLQEAVDYALLAGEQAFERLAFEQAAAHFRTGLDLVDLDPDPDEGDRAHLLLYLGRALHHCGEPQVAAVRLRDATIAARKAGDAQTFARAAIERTTWGAALGAEWTEDDDLLDEAAGLVSDDPALRARVLAEHVRWRSLWPTETLRAMSEEAVTLARASRDPAALALALAGAVWLTSDATGAEAVLDEVRSSQDRDNRDWQDELIFLQLGTIAALARADVGRARQYTASHQDLVARLPSARARHSRSLLETLWATIEGPPERAEELAVQTLELGHRVDSNEWIRVAVHATQLLVVRYLQGRVGELVEPIERQFEVIDTPVPTWWSALALARAGNGDVGGARQCVAALLAEGVDELPGRADWGPIVFHLGEVCATIGDATTAALIYERALQRSGTMCTFSGYLFLGAYDHHLGRLAAAAGQLDTARRHLAAALEQYERLGAVPWAARTSAAIDSLG